MSKENFPIIQENDVVTLTETYVKMPDGVGIYTRIAVPHGAVSCPIIFERTPYAKPLYGEPYNIENYSNNLAISHGYAIVYQHCRGTADSEGDMYPYLNEREDGLASLEFIRSLPFYNGEIYVSGRSYTASVHLLYLSEKPHDVKGACIEIQTDRLFFSKMRNGCNRSLNNLPWFASMAKRRFPNPAPYTPKRPYVNAAKEMFGVDMPDYTESLMQLEPDEHVTNDPRWYLMDSLEIPILLVEGWYDFYIDGMANMWERLPEKTKARSAMIIGPYGHATWVKPDSEYPFPNGDLPSDYLVEWFDSVRESRSFKRAELGKLTYYSIVGNNWKTTSYPAPDNGRRKLYLNEDLTLSATCPKSGSVSYKYDPDNSENPHQLFDIFKAPRPGSVDGIISFISECEESEKRFFGKVKFGVKVSSDCEDTAFFLRLYFVDGEESYNLTETVFALSHFVKDYVPGDVAEIEVETPPIAFTLKKGMKLRIDVSSVAGPYVPHANVRGHFALVTETRVAKNTIYTDGSYIEIPYEI